MSFQHTELNDFLATRSYIEGYVPSQADVAVLEHLGGVAVDTSLCHLGRWHRHISSYSSQDKLAFPGIKKDVSEYGIKSAASEGATCKEDAGQGEGEGDDDFDLFGDDDEDADMLKQQRQDALKEKMKEAEERQKKKKAEAKSTIVLEVKPYDDETKMEDLEKLVRVIQMEGLNWGKSQSVPVAYGIEKLQISAVILDELVSTDLLCEMIENDEIVQSTDIVSFQKFS